MIAASVSLLLAPLGLMNMPLREDVAPRAEPIQFEGFGRTRLQGEFLLPPTTGQRAPGVLLLPGSGPTDRNGNQLGLNTNLLKDLAGHLAAKGYATLRFDKRAVPVPFNTSQWPRGAEALNEYFGWDAFTGDAAAAYRRLRWHPNVDPQRVLILGHSEGGLIALALASRVQPNGLILLGTPGRPLGDILVEQVDSQMDRQPMDANLRETIKQQNRDAVAAYRAGRAYDGPLHPGLRSLYNPTVAKYLQGTLGLDPAPLLRRYAGPVFLANGESDIQVHVDRDMMHLARQSERRKAVRIPKASHNFKAVSDPFKEPGFTGPIVPELYSALNAWLRENFPITQ